MPANRNEERSWRPKAASEAPEDPPESPVETLMRELQRRREVARTFRAFTRDYLNRLR